MDKYFTVDSEGSFYDTLTGKLVEEFPNAYLLEFFNGDTLLGGMQRVVFLKEQVNLNEEYNLSDQFI